MARGIELMRRRTILYTRDDLSADIEMEIDGYDFALFAIELDRAARDRGIDVRVEYAGDDDAVYCEVLDADHEDFAAVLDHVVEGGDWRSGGE